MSSDNKKPAISEAAVPIDPATLAELESLRARVAELEKNEADGGTARAVRPSERVLRGDGYKFTVGPIGKGSSLPIKTIECCDESEALRWYCATTEDPDPKKKGKQVDPTHAKLQVECVDPRRSKSVLTQQRVGYLRRKMEGGQVLTETEEKELQDAGILV
jgi:hypothetical protein